MILEFITWMNELPPSIALRESQYVWPLLESAHVMTLALFVGTAFVTDIRLLGWSLRRVRVSEVTDRLLPWTRLGFAGMLITGFLLFFGYPDRYYYNFFFRVKVILFVVAAINVIAFHRGIHQRVAEWDLDPKLPRQAFVAGAVSIVVWSLIVVVGRMIAYNWFECAIQPQPAFVNWFAGCVIDPAGAY
jgi:hypothetical protein